MDTLPIKAASRDFHGRFREIVSDPLNLLIARHAQAGTIRDGRVVLHNGHEVDLDGDFAYYGAFSEVLVVNRGVHEPLEELAFQEVLRHASPDFSMIELGAYWGHYSMWAAQVCPRARLTLVEPEIQNLAAGLKNFARNGYRGHFLQAFVGPGQFEVDAHLRESGLGTLDLLHSDIQGHEVAMLETASRALAERRIHRLFISTHSQEIHRRVESLLAAADYRIEISSDFINHTTAHDGLIVARSPLLAPMFVGFQPLGRLEIATAGPEKLAQYVSETAALFRIVS